jgi:hypothetical protein
MEVYHNFPIYLRRNFGNKRQLFEVIFWKGRRLEKGFMILEINGHMDK